MVEATPGREGTLTDFASVGATNGEADEQVAPNAAEDARFDLTLALIWARSVFEDLLRPWTVGIVFLSLGLVAWARARRSERARPLTDYRQARKKGRVRGDQETLEQFAKGLEKEVDCRELAARYRAAGVRIYRRKASGT